MKDKIYTQDEIQELLEDVRVLISDLGFDYDRMSRSGKDIYDELCEKIGID
jgi:hypothetical protein